MAEKVTIARPYAQAAFATAREQGDLKGWSELLQCAAAVAADEGMAAVIANPRISDEQLVTLFLELCGAGTKDAGKNMIRVLADNGRLDVLPEIAALYEEMRAEAEAKVEAQVISAKALSESQKSALAAALAKRLGREVSLVCSTDESLLGGAIIRSGDMVIDGSVVGKLDKISSQLLR
jgi:F-type H+-transporting ATPase subunit delta